MQIITNSYYIFVVSNQLIISLMMFYILVRLKLLLTKVIYNLYFTSTQDQITTNILRFTLIHLMINIII